MGWITLHTEMCIELGQWTWQIQQCQWSCVLWM